MPSKKIYSFTTVYQETAKSGKLLFWIINGLGISFYNPKIPQRYKHIPAAYAGIVMIWFFVHYPIGIYLTRDAFKFTLPMFAIYLTKFCENLAPVLVISRSVYEKGHSMQDRIGDLIYADQCLYLAGIKVWFSAMERYLKVSLTLVTAYCTLLSCLYISATSQSLRVIYNFYSALILAIDSSSSTIYNIYLSYYFCSVMYILKYRFQALNEEIKLITLKKTRDSHMQGIFRVTLYQVRDIAKIRAIKFAHAIYREYALAHNKRYGHVLLLQFFQSTVMTVLNIYFLMNIMYQVTRNRAVYYPPVTIILIMISVVVEVVKNFIVQLGLTIVTCYRTGQEANNMENVIHELMSETDDKEILRELEDFSLELIHGKVEFTAFDCFTIDYSLFTKIIGAVASYVIIFLQFGNFDYQEIYNNVEQNETTTK